MIDCAKNRLKLEQLCFLQSPLTVAKLAKKLDVVLKLYSGNIFVNNGDNNYAIAFN